MKKIANIVSDNTIDVSEIFNVVKTMDEIQHGLPTLIVGLDHADKLYPDFDITDICLAPNVYWTFKKTQKRDKYAEDLNFFINKVYYDLLKGVTYYFVDLIQNKTRTLKRVIQKIREFKHITTYMHNDMIYIYSDNLIFGIDLKLARYVGMDVDKLIIKIKSVSNVFLTDDEILIEYKKNLEEMDLQARYIPYLVSIINE
jgi:hypothetical protein